MIERMKILVIEDSPQDAELQERELLQGGLVFTSRVIQTRAELERALRDFGPDLVLSDYTLPDMDGLAALEITRRLAPEVPFIFVSGTLGEERAIESLKRGATDYISKDRLGGLVPKVRRALKQVEEQAEHRRLEQQLRQALKMEAVGRLAGGIAHDFNNLLTVINGYSQTIVNRSSPEDPNRADAEEILRAGERAASLTRQLLGFSRKQMTAPVVLNLNRTVSEIEKMLRRLMGPDIELRSALDPGLGNIRADPGQIEQVLMNLVLNARDAMPQGGSLTLETANIDLEDRYVRAHPGARAGAHVMLAVSDSGVGMDQDTQSHLFEPFFTTKGPGKGTGLGLSSVYGIVKQSGGSIWVYSEPGRGSSFKVYLPRVEAAVESPAPTRWRPGGIRGTETVLIVEDTLGVRTLMERVLRAEGYAPLAASNGEEALQVLGSYFGPVHLLLSDIVLPRMSGPEVALRVHSLRPEIRVLFTSGYTDAAVLSNGVLRSGIPYLQKPFTAEELSRKVREVLDAPAAPLLLPGAPPLPLP